jgi:hypothetical protein
MNVFRERLRMAKATLRERTSLMTAPKHGGWHQEKGTIMRTQSPDPPPVVTSVKKPPADSWWTRPVSREEFDRIAKQRSQEAGWVGKPRKEQG